MRVALLTAVTMIGFASNSLLTRGAIEAGRIDWASFMTIRLVSGAATLAILVRLRASAATDRGSWIGGIMLAGYAVAFSAAYTRIGAAIGALLLFGAVQVTMIGTGLARGERPARIDWAGVGLSIGGLVVLTLPGLTAPDALGAAMMIVAGICWGAYSLLGQHARDPLAATAANFLRASMLGVPVVAWWLVAAQLSGSGVALAVASGSLASGVAYSIWYLVLPSLAAWRASIIQLSVPVLTALLAAAILSEALTSRLFAATALIAVGVGVTLVPAWHRQPGRERAARR